MDRYGNDGTRFCELGFVKLINAAKSEKVLAAAIEVRPDVPSELMCRS